jgi:signal transduction histidine kinase
MRERPDAVPGPAAPETPLLDAVLSHLPVAVAVLEVGSRQVVLERNFAPGLRAGLFAGEEARIAPPPGWCRGPGNPIEGADWPVARCLRGESFHHEILQFTGEDGIRTFRVSGGPARGRPTQAVMTWEETSRSPSAASHPEFYDFLAEVSHDLRTPITSILGWTRLLAEGFLPEDKHDHGLLVIERNARLQMHLVEDLLDTWLLLAGRLQVHPRPIVLPPFIERVVESIRPLASRQGVLLTASVSSDCGGALLDPDRLEQLLWNAISKSIKFTERGGAVDVRALHADGRLSLEVHDPDNRGGRNPALDSVAMANRHPGRVGLGLGMMKHLVELQGGTLEERADGGGAGATLIIALPTRPSAS